ncbi:MAG: DUF4625 domain-containing protein [Lunatimonas sp.]|uniref:DUF4625 domain-containing protein n=1 Tax=Lunatimonas sp. TaxID=2060141 RepID=UPI00263AB0DE|nr:DUF4625 domain-containing protein [Lunatimonas sp.]MCC5936535.1 DUF4625 domain-containing protein [Lunatimonas sp.]
MKKGFSFLVLGVSLCLIACETDDDQMRDLTAPVIGAADGRDEIRPVHGETRAATTDHMHVRFSVEDPSGIAQIRVDVHNSFDGHSHGRIMTGFEPLDVDDIYSPDASNPTFRFPQGATRVSVDGTGTDIYWGGNNSRVNGNVLAGPYDFSIQAIDIHGNQTSFGDGSNYLATFYIRTPYAPEVNVTNLHDGELEGEHGEPLEVEGVIRKTSHELSSDLKFVWVRLAEEDDDHDHDGHAHARVMTGEFYERMWGTSTWRQGFSGPELPHSSEIDLAELLSGDDAIMVPDGEDHLDLIIWVEDVSGNISRYVFEVHAH